MSETTLQLENMSCPSCMQKIVYTVNDLEGVRDTRVIFNAGKARVYFDAAVISEEKIIEKIVEMGYGATKVK